MSELKRAETIADLRVGMRVRYEPPTPGEAGNESVVVGLHPDQCREEGGLVDLADGQIKFFKCDMDGGARTWTILEPAAGEQG